MQKVQSRAERFSDPEENPPEALHRFVGLMKCDYGSCGETGTIAGNFLVEWYAGQDAEETSYQVLSLVPSPLPFPLGKKVPKAVEQTIREAAALFWPDHKAAVTRAREVIAAVLTDLGLPTLTANGKDMRLADRIGLFAKLDAGKWSEQAEIIEAAKWLANEGTHDAITRDDALDAFAMLETVIDDIYVRTRHDLLAKVKKINAAHKPPARSA